MYSSRSARGFLLAKREDYTVPPLLHAILPAKLLPSLQTNLCIEPQSTRSALLIRMRVKWKCHAPALTIPYLLAVVSQVVTPAARLDLGVQRVATANF